jgi:hypothetical protein
MSNMRDASVEESFFAGPARADEPLTDARGAAARIAIERAFVAARRRRFARYEMLATALSVLVCMAAFAPALARLLAD